MAINSLKVLRIASEVNGLSDDELDILCDCINEPIADKMNNYLSFYLQDKSYLSIPVQDPVC